MNTKAINRIIDAAHIIGGHDLEKYQGYSGRGMYGKTTDGITGTWPAFASCAAYAASIFNEQDDENYSIDDFCQDIADVNTDSMGRSDLIFY